MKKQPIDYFRLFLADTALFGAKAATVCGPEIFRDRQHSVRLGYAQRAQARALYIRETIRVIESLDLTADQKDQIFRRNAEKLLRLHGFSVPVRHAAYLLHPAEPLGTTRIRIGIQAAAFLRLVRADSLIPVDRSSPPVLYGPNQVQSNISSLKNSAEIKGDRNVVVVQSPAYSQPACSQPQLLRLYRRPSPNPPAPYRER